MINNNGKFQIKYSFNEKLGENKEKEFFYFLGLMASDGNVKNDRVFSITQSKDEGLNLLTHIKEILNSNHKISTYEKTNSHRITITSKKLVNLLGEYNVVPNKTLIFKLPKLEEKELNFFLQGYIDGDGSIGINDNGKNVKYLQVSFVGTKNFIDDVNEKLKIKGIVRKIKKCKNLYEIRFNGKRAVDFCKEIYSEPITRHYKFKKVKEFLNNDEYGKKYKKYYNVKDEILLKLKEGQSVLDLHHYYKIPYKIIHQWKKRQQLI